MLQTFKANLKGNKLEWLDEQPTFINEQSKQVYVVVLEEPLDNKAINKTTVTALQEIENGGGQVFSSVDELFKDLDN
jgi:hypothetical protein